MSWEGIKSFASEIDKGVRGLLEDKIKNDGKILIGEKYSEFIAAEQKLLNHIGLATNIEIDKETGNFAALVNLPEDHIDAKANGAPINLYAKEKHDQLTNKFLFYCKNPYYRNEMLARLNNHKSNFASHLSANEAKSIAAEKQKRVIETIERNAKNIALNPSNFAASMLDTRNQIDALGFTQQEKDALLKQAGNNYATANAHWVINNEPASLLSEEGLQKNQEWISMLDTNQFLRLQVKAKNKYDINARQEIAGTQPKINNNLAAIKESGEEITGMDVEIMRGLGSSPELQKQYLAKKEIAYLVHRTYSEYDELPLNQKEAYLTNLASKISNISNIEEQQKQKEVFGEILKLTQKDQNLLKTDPASWADKHIANIENISGEAILSQEEEEVSLPRRFASRIAIYDRLGVSEEDRKFFTNSERQLLVEQILKFQDNPKRLKEEINKLTSNLKADNLAQYYPSIIGELFFDEKAKKKFTPLIANIIEFTIKEEDPAIIESLITAAGTKDYSNSNSSKEVKEKIAELNQPLRAYFTGLDPFVRNQEYENDLQTINNVALFYIQQSGDYSEANITRLYEKAREDILYTKYHQGALEQQGILIPKKIITDAEVININETIILDNLAFLKKQLKEDIINNIDQIDIKKSFGIVLNKNADSMDYSDIREAIDKATFVLSPDKKSFYVKFPSPDGRFAIFTLQGAKGQPKIFNLENLNIENTQAKQKMQEAESWIMNFPLGGF